MKTSYAHFNSTFAAAQVRTSFTTLKRHESVPGMLVWDILRRMPRLLLLLSLCGGLIPAQDRFSQLMRDLLIFDAHIDTPRYLVDEGYKLADEHGYYELDIPRMRKGHLGAVLFGIYAQPQDFAPAQWLPRALECLDALHREVEANRNDIEFAYSAADVERIHRSGKLAALASLEGGHLIADSTGVLRAFYRLGVRYMTLAHFESNSFADSMTGKELHGGLSNQGRDLVREMNRLGMMVDVSHISDKAVLAAVNESKAPVLASHSSSRKITPIVRNMPDEVISAIAKKGGVVCINFHAGYLDKDAYDVYIRNRPREIRRFRKFLHSGQPIPRAGSRSGRFRKNTSSRCQRSTTMCCWSTSITWRNWPEPITWVSDPTSTGSPA